MSSRLFKSGYVAVVGRPNVGKSTLINALLGQKLMAVSSKPQTTRHRILGIKTWAGGQLLFLDTPGVHQPHKALNEAMTRDIASALSNADLVLHVVEAASEIHREDVKVHDMLSGGRVLPFGFCGTPRQMGSKASGRGAPGLRPPPPPPPGGSRENQLAASNSPRSLREAPSRLTATPCILVINKIDKVYKPKILPMVELLTKKFNPEAVIPVSALKKENLEALEKEILRHLPEGPRYFPEEQLSDRNERFFAAEVIREKVMELTREEVPYAIGVVIEEFKERAICPREKVYIRGAILVEKESQKGILVGQGGKMIKKIGTLARQELEERLGQGVFLELFVRVEADWTKSPEKVREFF